MNSWKKEIPTTPMSGETESLWLPMDTEERFDEIRPSGWTKESITYKFNSHGYRSVEFKDDGKYAVPSIGCSVTIGIGLPHEYTWPELFCQKLESHLNAEVKNYNLGWGGIQQRLYCQDPA